MPELPEVETVVRHLRPVMVGQKITDIKLNRKTLRFPIPKSFIDTLREQTIISIDRRAKYILISLSNGFVWITHLGMSGMLSLRGAGQKHDHAVITLASGKTIIFNDPRRFGFLDIVHENELKNHKFLHHLGLEPLDRSFTAPTLYDRLRGKKTPIKTAIMDQKIVVGVGNIYASESLYDSYIHPEIHACDVTFDECELLVKSIKQTLRRAIKAGGSTIQMYHNPSGTSGYFQHHFNVYDRAGEVCARHTSSPAFIEKIQQQGRSTYFCPICQPSPINRRAICSKRR
jgi:formamidopyrimidine-DNA glycosylase